MKSRLVLAVVLSASLAAVIWALSVPITGYKEPWDAEGPYYYLMGLAIAGAVSGAAIPRHLWAHYVGAVLGQVAYGLAFLKLGPLFIVGLAFLAGYTILFVVAAAIASLLRKSGSDEATAV